MFVHFTRYYGYIVKVWWERRQYFFCKFLTESKSEIILKICQHLAKFGTKNIVGATLVGPPCKAEK